MEFAEDSTVHSDRVLLMVTIPLTKERFHRDLKKPFFSLNHKAKEFTKLYALGSGSGWEGYFSDVAGYILSDIQLLSANSSCLIDYDVDYEKFKLAMSTDQFDVIFLFAHHIMSEGA